MTVVHLSVQSRGVTETSTTRRSALYPPSPTLYHIKTTTKTTLVPDSARQTNCVHKVSKLYMYQPHYNLNFENYCEIYPIINKPMLTYCRFPHIKYPVQTSHFLYYITKQVLWITQCVSSIES